MRFSVTNSNIGLGDTLSIFSLFDKPRDFAASSGSPHFDTLAKYNPFVTKKDMWPKVRLEQIQAADKTVGRHFFNKIRVHFDLDELICPRPFLFVDNPEKPARPRICFSFDVGAHAHVQRQKIHLRARMLYPEHRDTFQQFINDTTDKFDFYEIGRDGIGFDNAENCLNIGLDQTIQILAGASAYVGMHSGMMHLAAALRIPSLTIINFPEASKVAWPIKENDHDLDWLYPQNYHLHEDANGSQAPLMNYNVLADRVFDMVGENE